MYSADDRSGPGVQRFKGCILITIHPFFKRFARENRPLQHPYQSRTWYLAIMWQNQYFLRNRLNWTFYEFININQNRFAKKLFFRFFALIYQKIFQKTKNLKAHIAYAGRFQGMKKANLHSTSCPDI